MSKQTRIAAIINSHIIELKMVSEEDLNDMMRQAPGLEGFPVFYCISGDGHIKMWPQPEPTIELFKMVPL